jgi:hypothetical protein
MLLEEGKDLSINLPESDTKEITAPRNIHEKKGSKEV